MKSIFGLLIIHHYHLTDEHFLIEIHLQGKDESSKITFPRQWTQFSPKDGCSVHEEVLGLKHAPTSLVQEVHVAVAGISCCDDPVAISLLSTLSAHVN